MAAIHAAWVIAQDGVARADLTLLRGGLSILSRQEASASEAWTEVIGALEGEARFLARGRESTRTADAAAFDLPLVSLDVAPGETLRTSLPGKGDRAILAPGGGSLQLSILDALGTLLCTTATAALRCGGTGVLTAEVTNTGATTATVFLLGEPL